MTPDQLKHWRTEVMHLTQEQAAAELDVALPTYQSWEMGAAWKTGKPLKIKRVVALACAALAAGIEAP